jgi:hypothetical protein
MKVLLSLHPNKAARWSVADVEVAFQAKGGGDYGANLGRG